MNIYIKSFNRPFYLDRCIRSIKFNVKGFKKIIVLDDGTLHRYQKKLLDLHPEIEIRTSGADDEKFELLRHENFSKIEAKYPIASNFWVHELSQEPENYFFLLEDDAWVCRRLNLDIIRQALNAYDGVIYKCWWGPSVPQNHILHRTLKTPACDSIDFYNFDNHKLLDLYAIWLVAFAVFRKDYWINGFAGIKRMADEYSQLLNVQNFLNSNPHVEFSKSVKRCVYQGWIVPGRSTPEYYDKGLRQHLYMDALNESWYESEMNVTEGYPLDFSDGYIVSLLKKRLPNELINIWLSWRANDVQYFY